MSNPEHDPVAIRCATRLPARDGVSGARRSGRQRVTCVSRMAVQAWG